MSKSQIQLSLTQVRKLPLTAIDFESDPEQVKNTTEYQQLSCIHYLLAALGWEMTRCITETTAIRELLINALD